MIWTEEFLPGSWLSYLIPSQEFPRDVRAEFIFFAEAMMKTWKRVLKSKGKQLSSWRDNFFFSFDPPDLKQAISKLGIAQGDMVFVHGSFDSFRGFAGNPSDVIMVLQDIVGQKGSLMMPTMAFSGSAIDYALKHPVVDLVRTPSRMGLISEIFRRTPDVLRSPHPTHPIAIWGQEANALAADHPLANTPCGKSSPLHKLLEGNGKILLLGTDINVLTFYHTVEEILEKRLPLNPFTEHTYDLQVRDSEGRLWSCKTRLYEPSVSRRRRLARLREELVQMGAWREQRVGRLKVRLILARDVLQAVERLLERGMSCYD